MQSGLKRSARGAAICLLAWTVVGLFFYTQSLTQKLSSHNPTASWRYLTSWLSGVYICALATRLQSGRMYNARLKALAANSF
jgi:hypothetical protein